ncbi:MAG TPA: hypothetical protein DCW90_02980 [Lachnospiraceae bacterium]|nr:hypothetical protein [Lachnospiraceae bacterium]
MLEFVIIFSILAILKIVTKPNFVSGLCLLVSFDALLLTQEGWLIIPLLISLCAYSKGQNKRVYVNETYFITHWLNKWK